MHTELTLQKALVDMHSTNGIVVCVAQVEENGIPRTNTAVGSIVAQIHKNTQLWFCLQGTRSIVASQHLGPFYCGVMIVFS